MSTSNRSNQDAPAPPRRRGAMRIGRLLPKEARRAFLQYGFARPDVVTHWREIAGNRIAARTQPLRISYATGARRDGTLHILVDGPFAVELQHAGPTLVERVNAYFGYRAVSRISIVQGPLGRRLPSEAAVAPRLDAANRALLEEAIGTTQDSGLKEALTRLGQHILGRAERTMGRKSVAPSSESPSPRPSREAPRIKSTTKNN